MLFRDRQHAGQRLAAELADLRGEDGLLVLALPRGGVPVASEVADALRAPLDVFVVRKLGVPGNPEFAMGALASGGVRVLNDGIIAQLGIDGRAIAAVTEREQRELQRRERRYRGDRPWPSLAGRVVVLVDDGLATGSSMRAAVRALRRQHPARIVAAVPVAASDSAQALAAEVDRLACVAMPEPFLGVGRWYADFRQTSDDEVAGLLARAAVRHPLGYASNAEETAHVRH